jgi:hypothetical protein
MDQPDSDPEFQARRVQREAEFARRKAELDNAEIPLIEALHAAGVLVNQVWDLVNTRKPYPAALPVLIEHLRKTYPVEIREGIARALAVRESAFAWDTLAELFRQEQAPRVHEALALAVSEATDKRNLDKLIALAKDKVNGNDRLHLLPALKRLKDPSAFAAIEALASDPAFEYEISKYLRARNRRQHRDRRRDHK